jgi:predicted heme/steroid binding protein/uncharacterized membrane protein
VAEELKKFTVEELQAFNGEDGKPIYIAYKERVIDVTGSKMWRGGQHMKRHTAGADLTVDIAQAPHGIDVLDRFPQVGILVRDLQGEPKSEDVPGDLPAWLERFLARYPFFQRHPHPMTVHFPIVFMMFAPLFTLLYLATGVPGFDFTAVSCLAAGLFFCLIVIPTGFFTWWVNYMARPLRPVTIKIVVSLMMFADGLAALIWRLVDPTVVTCLAGPNLLYLVLILLLLPMIVVVASYGAILTFPLHTRDRQEPSKSDPD